MPPVAAGGLHAAFSAILANNASKLPSESVESRALFANSASSSRSASAFARASLSSIETISGTVSCDVIEAAGSVRSSGGTSRRAKGPANCAPLVTRNYPSEPRFGRGR